MARIKTIVGLFDVHLKDGVVEPAHSDVYGVAKKFISAFEPNEIVIGGDFLDCASLSHWNENKRLEVEGKRFQNEISVANKELDFLQSCSNKVTFLEGNHCQWIDQYIERHPAMEGLMNLQKVLGFKKRKIEFIPYCDGNLYKTGSLYWCHGYYAGEHHAKKHFQKFGCNIMYGHVHNYQTYSANMKMHEPYVSTSVGCLCDPKASYLKGKPANWVNQFVVVYLDSKTGAFNIYPVTIIGGSFIWDGRLFK